MSFCLSVNPPLTNVDSSSLTPHAVAISSIAFLVFPTFWEATLSSIFISFCLSGFPSAAKYSSLNLLVYWLAAE